MLYEKNSVVLVVEEKEEEKEECWTVIAFAQWNTHPGRQGRGAGTLLVNWGVELAGKCGIDVSVETSGATIFYKKLGFDLLGTVKIQKLESRNRWICQLWFTDT